MRVTVPTHLILLGSAVGADEASCGTVGDSLGRARDSYLFALARDKSCVCLKTVSK
jgi:hypothetical protein